VQANGDLFRGYKVFAQGLNIKIQNPNVWISQVRGLLSLEVLNAALDGSMPDRFRYFDHAEVSIGSQRCWVSRSSLTNELGWEGYFGQKLKLQRLTTVLCRSVKDLIHSLHPRIPCAADRGRAVERGVSFCCQYNPVLGWIGRFGRVL